jgi:hypothetical protein
VLTAGGTSTNGTGSAAEAERWNMP